MNAAGKNRATRSRTQAKSGRSAKASGLAGMTARAGALWRRCALPAPSAIKPGGGQVRDLPQFALPALATRLRGAGYRVQETADALVAVKNRWTPLATLLFHLSFIVLLVGGRQRSTPAFGPKRTWRWVSRFRGAIPAS